MKAWLFVAVASTAIITAKAFAAETVSAPPPVRAFAFDTAYTPADGEPLYKAHCAACHDHPTGRTPAKAVIANNTPPYIFDVLNDGVMRANAASLSRGERLAIAMYVSQNKSGGVVSKTTSETPLCRKKPPRLKSTGFGWNGWGRTVENTRYQPDPGLTVTQVPRLKLKWAMGVAGSRNGQPVIAGGRLFTNNTASSVYALDAKTGCAYWRFNAEGPTRSTISLAELPKAKSRTARIAAFFTDALGYLYAINADDGTLLWRTKIDSQRTHQFTGGVAVYDGVVYVPVSSGTEAYAQDDNYPCCMFRGAVVAVSVVAGEILWTTYTTQSEPKPFAKNRLGKPLFGPSGGAIWSAPTIDARRGLIYVATGDSYTDAPYDGADAVIAMEMKSGKVVWLNQFTKDDNYVIGCRDPDPKVKLPANCPTVVGRDLDFGASPTLVTGADGKQMILASQKSSQVYALDPDDQGRVIWEKRLSRGGPLGGSEWGHAVDDRNIYIGISDIYVRDAKPQLTALRIADGELVWSQPMAPRPCRWTNVYCYPGISMAVTAIPGAVFAGTMDGRLGAYAVEDGKVLWSVDTAQPFTTTAGTTAEGGTLDAAGPVIVNGMLYVHSGYWGRSGPGSVLLAYSVDGK